MDVRHKIIVINPGSTSTKFALYENDRPLFVSTLRHTDDQLAPFRGKPILDQADFRYTALLAELKSHAHDATNISAAVGRGGLLRPLTSGTYLVNETMLEEFRLAVRGEHASNLGAFLGKSMAE